MVKIRYDINLMKYISIFESLTCAKIKDCLSNERLLFIVQEGQIGKAIGKNGVNAKKLCNILKREIKIVDFSSNVLQFIQNMIHPLKVRDIKENEGIITLVGNDVKTKGMLIGRDSKNLNFLTSVVKRHFDIKQIKVV